MKEAMKSIACCLVVSMCLFAGCDAGGGGVMEPQRPTPYELQIPEGFPLMEIPEDNPMTVEGVDLGRRLFFDPILSRDSTLSCSSCHLSATSFTDPAQFSVGVRGERGRRNSMALINVGYAESLFWDGRAASLEEQARDPVVDALELDEDWEHVEAKLNRHPRYPDLFEQAFGTRAATRDLAVKAIAQFERTLLSAGSRFDRVTAGVETFSDLEAEGFEIFNSERGDCFHCHGTLLLTDNRFHNNGLDANPDDLGLAEVTGRPFDRGLFKTPTLRNVEYTAPYMHDGRFATLEEVVDHYSTGVQHSSTLDPIMLQRGPLNLTDEEKTALIAFLKTLSDPAFLSDPAHSNPFRQ